MKLVIDIGNTRIKCALFQKQELKEHFVVENIALLRKVVRDHSGPVILSSVRELSLSFTTFLKQSGVMILDHKTSIPISLFYKTPETLGSDRIAAACGAWGLCKQSTLVVDIGTCITLDFISANGEFLGGNISPGPELRFRSMNNFTSALPLENLSNENYLIGKSTRMALSVGVKQSIIYEIQGTYDQFKQENPKCKLVLTGGYSSYFDTNLKGGIFAEPNLVFVGLNSILDYNV